MAPTSVYRAAAVGDRAIQLAIGVQTQLHCHTAANVQQATWSPHLRAGRNALPHRKLTTINHSMSVVMWSSRAVGLPLPLSSP